MIPVQNVAAAKTKLTTARLVAAALIVGALGVTMALQGWRSDVPGDDVIPYIDGAHALLSHGRLPDHGHPTSYHSYATPGLAWVTLPGVWLLHDVRLVDVPGNAILHLGTLIGILLLARGCFGDRCALLAVLLYGISEQGLMFAHTYAPKGRHEFFYVWMAYWMCRWVSRQDAKYLAAALLTWIAGMYMFMEMAPAIFIVPAVWLVYKPAVRTRAFAAVAVVGLVLWYPYLRFEAGRRFADVRSQVLLETLHTADSAPSFCNPAAVFRSVSVAGDRTVVSSEPESALLTLRHGLTGNFEGRIPGVHWVLFVFAVAGLFIAGIGARRARVFAIALVVPWLLLLVLAERGRADRFVGLWPLQIVALAVFVDVVAARTGSRAGRLVRATLMVAVAGLLAVNPFLISRARGWWRDGFAGRDADEVRVAAYLASELRSGNRRSAAIGRQLFLEDQPVEAPWRAVDARWRAGEAIDLVLNYRDDLINLNQCGEGVSAGDEYRVVESRPPTPDAVYYFDVQPSGHLAWVTQIGRYQIYKRD